MRTSLFPSFPPALLLTAALLLLSLAFTPAAHAQRSGVSASHGVVVDAWSSQFPASLPWGSFWWDDEPLATADMDLDGHDDLVYAELGWTTNAQVSAWAASDGQTLWSVTNYGGYYSSLATHPDLNGDGKGEVLLGSANQIHIRSGNDGSLLHTLYGASPWEEFGAAVASVPDIDGDGIFEFLVGAPRSSAGAFYAGSAYLYSGSGIGQPPLLRVDGANTWDSFGAGVEGTEDLDGDGTPDFLVGAPGTNGYQGTVYAFSGATGLEIWNWDGLPGDEAGLSIQSIDDLDLDGVRDVVLETVILSGADGSVIRSFYDGLAVGDYDRDGVQDLIGGTGSLLPGSTIFEAGLFSGRSGELLFGLCEGRLNDEEIWAMGGPDVDGDGRHELYVLVFPDSGNPIVWLEEVEPGLRASTDTISLAAGGPLRIDLDFLPRSAFQEYRIVTSGSGAGYLPVSLTLVLPLAYDQTVYQTYLGQYPPFATGMFGMLDAQGKATGLIAFPPGLPASLLGKTYTIAAMAGYPWGFWTATSFPASWTFVP